MTSPSPNIIPPERLIDREALAIQIAEVVGDNSAAAAALKELNRRRDAGENVMLILELTYWLVVPKLI